MSDEISTVDVERSKWLQDARNLLDFLEKKPEFIDEIDKIDLTVYVWGDGFTAEEQNKSSKKKLSKFARLLGSAEKIWTDHSLTVKKKFGVHQVSLYVGRERVCERKVVGTELVPEYRVAAHEREIVEWVCEDPVILKAVS